MKSLLSSKPIVPAAISIIRIIFGVLLIIHGSQAFDSNAMSGYGDWMRELEVPFPDHMPYVGKAVEFLGGICLALGIFTRLASAALFVTFMFISFVMGEGKILTDSQHAFMFALFSLLFFFQGAGPFSVARR